MSGVTLLVFARCVGFAARAPGFGHPSVPAPVRVVVALALTAAVAPALRHARAPDGIELVIAIACEALLGAAIGTFASLLYDAAYAGGRVVDDYTGVRAIAPSVEIVAPSGFGRIWSLAFTAGFFLTGAYRIAIVAFANGFAVLPPGAVPSSAALLAYGAALVRTIVLVALAVAGPAVALALVAQIAVATLGRTVPRFGSVTLASPLVFAAALLATLIAVPAMSAMAAHPYVDPPILSARR